MIGISKLNSPKQKIKLNRKRKISKTPRLVENDSRGDKMTISNDANKTFNDNDKSPLYFKKLQQEKKNDGTLTEYALNNNASQEKLFEQFALKDYTEKEFQVMGSIVSLIKTIFIGW